MPTAKKSKGMPKWQPAPDELVRTFEHALQSFPDAQLRKMFGYPAAFVNGRMFAGLHQENLILRLPDEERAEFLKSQGAKIFEPMPGRPMREYVVVPPAILKSQARLKSWLEKALAYTAALPPKARKKRAI